MTSSEFKDDANSTNNEESDANTLAVEFVHRLTLGGLWGISHSWSLSLELAFGKTATDKAREADQMINQTQTLSLTFFKLTLFSHLENLNNEGPSFDRGFFRAGHER